MLAKITNHNASVGCAICLVYDTDVLNALTHHVDDQPSGTVSVSLSGSRRHRTSLVESFWANCSAVSLNISSLSLGHCLILTTVYIYRHKGIFFHAGTESTKLHGHWLSTLRCVQVQLYVRDTGDVR